MTTSPSGVRMSGDDYQHLVSWYNALRMLDPTGDVIAISIEAAEAGIVDDLLVHHRNGNDEHYQIKFSVDASHPIDNAWWTSPSKSGPSILQRFWDSFQRLSKPGYRPRLSLFTNRPIDPYDPLLKLRESGRGCLGQRLRLETPRSEAGKRRAAWAAHLGISEERLLEMLDNLELLTDQGPWSPLVVATGDRMAAVRLKRDELSVEQGIVACRNWAKAGITRVDLAMLEAEIRRRSLLGEAAWATFVVQAIDHHPWAEGAQASLDWVDLFDGDRPEARRRLKDPTLWNGRLVNELRAACARLDAARYDRVLVRGHMRLPIAFMVGRCLPAVRNIHLACMQRQQQWTTEAKAVAADVLSKTEELGLGDELAIGLSVARSLGDDVVGYVREGGLPVRRFVHLHLPEVHGQSMPDAGYAMGWAMKVVELISREARKDKAPKIHLFLATPFGAALFLGHVWNRLPPTQIYEDIGSAYEPTFFVSA